MEAVCWAYYMDILNCFRYVKQPHNFIQPLVRLRTSCPWCSLLGADQEEVLCWPLLGGAALEQCPWHCQRWHKLGDSPWKHRQPGWGRGDATAALSQLCPAATGAFAQGKEGGKCSTACGALGCNLCSGLFPSAWPCKNTAFLKWFSRLSETPSLQDRIWCGQLNLTCPEVGKWIFAVLVCSRDFTLGGARSVSVIDTSAVWNHWVISIFTEFMMANYKKSIFYLEFPFPTVWNAEQYNRKVDEGTVLTRLLF